MRKIHFHDSRSLFPPNLLGAVETFTILPIPKCHTCYWENDNFGKCVLTMPVYFPESNFNI